MDPLRGLAALAVCLFHFTRGNAGFLSEDDPVGSVGSFGWLGVEAFFELSGFVIPYSLNLRSYKLRDCGAFLIRRFKRVEPPYFACIGLVILLHLISTQFPDFRGGPLNLSWPKFAAHFAYLNAILDYGWLNPVFWTLAIECQYYIFVAILFPILDHTNTYLRHCSTLLIAVLGFGGLNNPALLPHWLPLFAIGMVAYQFYVNRIGPISFLLILVTISFLSFSSIGPLQTIVGLFTAGTIILAKDKQLPNYCIPLSFIGTISYSLYLVHVPIGSRVINLAHRLPDSIIYRYPAIFLALVVSVLFAYGFWRLIERPTQRWSKISFPRNPASSQKD